MNGRPPIGIGRGLRWTLLVVSTMLLLLSFGGAIIAAPIAIPLLLLSARSSSSAAYRSWAGIVVVLTTAEVVWALTYLVQRDAKPAIWLVPFAAGLASVVGYSRLSRPRATA